MQASTHEEHALVSGGAIELAPVAQAGWSQAHEVFTQGYSDYPIDLCMDHAAFERRFRTENVCADLSYIAWREGRLAGLVLIGERGATRRMAALCVAPWARRGGTARTLISRVIGDLDGLDAAQLSLEVLEGNLGARALYIAAGFRERRQLLGYRPGGEIAAGGVADGGLQRLAVLPENVCSHDGDLPWPAQIRSLAGSGNDVNFIANGDHSVVAAVRVRCSEVVVLSVVDIGGDEQRVSDFAQSLIAAYGPALRAPALYPSGYLDAFFRYWKEDDVRQIEMTLDRSDSQRIVANDRLARQQN